MAAVLCTNAARHGASTWNSPVWPLLPLLLNRLTELLALGFGHIYLTVRGACCRLPSQAHSCPPGNINAAPWSKASLLQTVRRLPCQKLWQALKATVAPRLPLVMPLCVVDVQNVAVGARAAGWPECVDFGNCAATCASVSSPRLTE